MNAFFAQHLNALKSAPVRRLLASPLNTLLSLLVIGTALALPSAGWLVLDNLRSVTGSASGVQQVSIVHDVMDAGKKETSAKSKHDLREAQGRRTGALSRAKMKRLKRLQASEGMSRDHRQPAASNPAARRFRRRTKSDTRPESLETTGQDDSRVGRRSPMCSLIRRGSNGSTPSCASASCRSRCLACCSPAHWSSSPSTPSVCKSWRKRPRLKSPS